GLADNGYLFLSRSVSLPFSIPDVGARSRLRSLEAAMETREDLMYRIIAANVERRRAKYRIDPVPPTDPGIPGIPMSHPGFPEVDPEVDAVRCIHEAFRCLHDASDALSRYIPANGAHVRRIVNTVPITLRLLLHRAGITGIVGMSGKSGMSGIYEAMPSPRAAAAWVVLADRWPCRLSWALQCLEDAPDPAPDPKPDPRMDPGADPAADPGSRKLWSVFQAHVAELSALRQPLRNLLSLDGDPEQFRAFLDSDFPFTAREAREFLGVTVNLDHSIRHKMGLLRALERLQRAAKAPPVSRGVQCPPN
ncbi:NTPase KAP family P-loop domain-containing protein 1, partial [Neopelma chrysocephalum]|uniref:NTPase KAP family P-loop domain-containing protein 1 n=1 Tax=Neopelma chrysocephalum TaxID=114329 RepID=UPI000FCD38DF